jgi:hypothetical protein
MELNKKFIHKLALTIILPIMVCMDAYSSNSPSIFSLEFITDAGSRPTFQIYEQDPDVIELGVRRIVIPTAVDVGPGNNYIQVMQDVALPNAEGNFIFDMEDPRFDACHTFAVVWATHLMYRQDLEYLAQKYPQNPKYPEVIKRWDSCADGKLLIYQKSDPDDQNAFYTRYTDDFGKTVRELRFYSFDGLKGRVHSCRSHDVVAHETGHKILDDLHPEYFDNSTALLGGFHEAFGDLTAIFAALNQYDQCAALYADTKGDLSKQSFITQLAEQFGTGVGNVAGLRNLEDNVTMTSVNNEVHDLSRVFTNAVYGILADAYAENDNKHGYMKNGPALINSISIYLRRMVLQTVLEMNKPQPTFSDFAFKMYDIATHQPKTKETESGLVWAEYIKKNFTERGIPVEENSRVLDGINKAAKFGLKARVCGTINKHCQ